MGIHRIALVMAAFRAYLTAVHAGDPSSISWGTTSLTQTTSAHGLSYSAHWDTGAAGLGPHTLPPGPGPGPGPGPAYVSLDYLTGALPGLSFLGGSNPVLEHLTAGLGSGLLLFEAACDTAVRDFVVGGDMLLHKPVCVPCRVLTGKVTALSPVGATPTSGTRHLLVVSAGDLACAGYPGGKAAPFLLHRMSEFTKAWLALFAWHLTDTEGDVAQAIGYTNAHSTAATWAMMGDDMLRLLWVSKHNKKDATFTQPVPLPDLADEAIGGEDEVFVGMKPGPAVAWCNSWCSDLYRAPCNLFCPGAVQVCRVAFNADPHRHTLRLDEDTTDIATDLCGGKDATPANLSAAFLAVGGGMGPAEVAAATDSGSEDENDSDGEGVEEEKGGDGDGDRAGDDDEDDEDDDEVVWGSSPDNDSDSDSDSDSDRLGGGGGAGAGHGSRHEAKQRPDPPAYPPWSGLDMKLMLQDVLVDVPPGFVPSKRNAFSLSSLVPASNLEPVRRQQERVDTDISRPSIRWGSGVSQDFLPRYLRYLDNEAMTELLSEIRKASAGAPDVESAPPHLKNLDQTLGPIPLCIVHSFCVAVAAFNEDENATVKTHEVLVKSVHRALINFLRYLTVDIHTQFAVGITGPGAPMVVTPRLSKGGSEHPAGGFSMSMFGVMGCFLSHVRNLADPETRTRALPGLILKLAMFAVKAESTVVCTIGGATIALSSLRGLVDVEGELNDEAVNAFAWLLNIYGDTANKWEPQAPRYAKSISTPWVMDRVTKEVYVDQPSGSGGSRQYPTPKQFAVETCGLGLDRGWPRRPTVFPVNFSHHWGVVVHTAKGEFKSFDSLDFNPFSKIEPILTYGRGVLRDALRKGAPIATGPDKDPTSKQYRVDAALPWIKGDASASTGGGSKGRSSSYSDERPLRCTSVHIPLQYGVKICGVYACAVMAALELGADRMETFRHRIGASNYQSPRDVWYFTRWRAVILQSILSGKFMAEDASALISLPDERSKPGASTPSSGAIHLD